MNDEHIIAYLRNELSTEKRKEVENWAASSKDNKRYFNRIKFLWEHSVSDFKNAAIRPELVWNRIEYAVNQERSVRSRTFSVVYRNFSRIAAIAIIAFGIGFLTIRTVRQNQIPESEWILAHAATGSNEIILPDKSRVWLNAGSGISYPEKFRGRLREVKIEGEAYFEVTRKRSKPFVIQAGSSGIRVLGTSFNVNHKHNAEKIIVTVLTGRIAFFESEKPENRIKLDAGEQGVYNTLNAELNKQVNTDDNFLSWKTGILIFDNTSLEDVCRDLSLHYMLTIVPSNADILKAKSLSATFDNKTVEEVLNILSITLDISYKTDDEIITLFPE